MSDIAIKVEGIGKKYKIGRRKSGDLRESLGNLYRYFSLKKSDNQSVINSEFWALKDVSFEVKQGEAIGIIGRNGAGKSTLLKVLSRIAQPTTGRIEIFGRVSSLLEVGTGFHPELTGRENIYLNGTILGMRRAEIKTKFDEIIAFSGVDEFIDTPVKHYSSGMKVRLAFSVAAHLEPEILIIDEVLAVGDAEFQKKCLGKMEDVAGQGRTVLFVSHNMGAVRKLCKRGCLIDNGSILKIGRTQEVINEYLALNRPNIERGKDTNLSLLETDDLVIDNCYATQDGKLNEKFSSKKEISLEVKYTVKQEGFYSIGIQLHTNLDIAVFSTVNWESSSTGDVYADKKLQPGAYKSTCVVPKDFLNEEMYKVSIVIISKGNHVSGILRDAFSFSIVNDGNMRSHFHGEWIGVVRPRLHWVTEFYE